MSAPVPSSEASSPLREILQGVLADLRRTAPETRAVLAGLVLVLGAWVGPGLPDSLAPSVAVPESRQSAPDPLGAQAMVPDAYREAVGTTTGEAGARAEEKPRTADDDED